MGFFTKSFIFFEETYCIPRFKNKTVFQKKKFEIKTKNKIQTKKYQKKKKFIALKKKKNKHTKKI